MLWRAVIFSTMLHETVANHREKPNVTVVKALRPRHQLQTPTSAPYPECYNEAAYLDIQLPWFNVFVRGNRISGWDVVLEGNYSRKDWTDVFSVNRWWQRSDWVVVRQLSNFHAMKAPSVTCDPDFWSVYVNVCVQKSVGEKKEVSQKINLTFSSLFWGCFLRTDSGLDARLFSPASLSWGHWVNDSIQAVDHGTGEPNCAQSPHFCSAFSET